MLAFSQRAVLAGGCFWGMQRLLRRYPGVVSTRIGLTGGDAPGAVDCDLGTNAEAVEVVFDPTKITYRSILEFFFQIHDPTTLNRQGKDIGARYRSIIFYTSDEQRQIADDTIFDVNASKLWPGEVVTEVISAGTFWECEPWQQRCVGHRFGGSTGHFIRPGWRLPSRPATRRTD